MSDRGTVAIVGAGPGGLVAARFLSAQGFAVTVYDRHAGVGGQWDTSNASSGVWPLMRTNTGRASTRFSDLEYPEGTAVYPHNREVLCYLRGYAGALDGAVRLRLGTEVTRVARAGAGFEVSARAPGDDAPGTARFDRVVVASGRYNDPTIPAVDGLDGFSGRGGVIHAFRYKDPERYRGLRVLVAGGNISALEIASDLAMLGAARVHTAMRRQRYVMPKIVAGVPTENLSFTRHAALFGEHASADEAQEDARAFILAAGGDPGRFGAPAPAGTVAEAGITGSQWFLPLVAEGRIDTHPWIERVDGTTVRFRDGSEAEVDAIIFGTGFRLSLPFLDADIRATLNVDDKALDLADHTLHPELEGLAFMGLWCQVGPYWPVLELQARYLAYSWGGRLPAPEPEVLHRKVAACAAGRLSPVDEFQHRMCLRFARLAGVEPDPSDFPELARALLFGPLTALSFRLHGPDAVRDAPIRIAREAERFGVVSGPGFSDPERGKLRRLAAMPGAPDYGPLLGAGEPAADTAA